MSDLTEVPAYLWTIVAYLAGLASAKFLPAYASKKGENFATKEDVAEITTRIEEVKSSFAKEIERHRTQLQIDAFVAQAFRSKALEAVEEINRLLVEIMVHCWRELAKRAPDEHYVWRNVDDDSDARQAGAQYYRVAIDKAIIVHGLYLNENAVKILSSLSKSMGLLSTVERGISLNGPIGDDKKIAIDGYSSGMKAIEHCRIKLLAEFGLMQSTAQMTDGSN